jgi:hypothetical protein
VIEGPHVPFPLEPLVHISPLAQSELIWQRPPSL